MDFRLFPRLRSLRAANGCWVAAAAVYAALGTSVGAFAESPRTDHPSASFTEIPEGVTSFGAAVAGKMLYIYGGHRGSEHEYSAEKQSNQFRRLNLSAGSKWEDLPSGPKLQGLAMVAHGGKLYRIGGFTAQNSEGQEHDLRSMPDVAIFDPKTTAWEHAPPLPEGRSSHDAVVLDGRIYVIGGWQLSGKDKEPHWHDTAYVMDLSAKSPRWQTLPTPPFKRRALSVGALNGKLYVIGGMQPDRQISLETVIFDVKSGKWSKGPSLPGEGMAGFGTSAFAANGAIYVSNVSANVYRLDEPASAWVEAGQLKEKRLFHRMVATEDQQLVVVGGAEWLKGKASGVYTVHVGTPAKSR
jgi:N-acetylneuraminic acid mutarotase